MAVITLTEAKTLLQITGTTYDSLITALIPIIESEIRSYTNQNWQDAPTLPSWEAWMKLPASEMIDDSIKKKNAGMKSESQGDYSYTKEDTIGGWPAGIMQSFDKVKIARIGYAHITKQYRDGRGLTEMGLEYPIPYGNPNEVIE